jgi:hypothetical protein
MGGKKRKKKIQPPGPGACTGLPPAGKGGRDVRRDFLEIVDEARRAQGDPHKSSQSDSTTVIKKKRLLILSLPLTLLLCHPHKSSQNDSTTVVLAKAADTIFTTNFTTNFITNFTTLL